MAPVAVLYSGSTDSDECAQNSGIRVCVSARKYTFLLTPSLLSLTLSLFCLID